MDGASKGPLSVLDMMQANATVSDSSRQVNLPPSETEAWIDQARSGIVSAEGQPGRYTQAAGVVAQSAAGSARLSNVGVARPKKSDTWLGKQDVT